MIEAAGELKTKPTQHSVNELRRIGITPDVVVCASAQPLSRELRAKIALFADLDTEAVDRRAGRRRTSTASRSRLHAQGFDDFVLRRFGIDAQPPDLEEWIALADRVDALEGPVRIAVVGKYVQLQDAYKSVVEALRARRHPPRARHRPRLRRRRGAVAGRGARPPASRRRRRAHPRRLRRARHRGQDHGGAVRPRAERAVPRRLPRHAGARSIEYARHVCGMEGANSTEFDLETPYPVVDLLPEQKEHRRQGRHDAPRRRARASCGPTRRPARPTAPS